MLAGCLDALQGFSTSPPLVNGVPCVPGLWYVPFAVKMPVYKGTLGYRSCMTLSHDKGTDVAGLALTLSCPVHGTM